MSEDTREFHIAEIAGMYTGYLYAKEIPVSGGNHPINGMYEISNFMTGDDIFTHQLPRVKKEVTPLLLEQFPWLSEIVPYKCTPEHTWDEGWEISYNALQELIAKYGEYHSVIRMHPEDHEVIDPITEAQSLVGDKNIIIVNMDDDEPNPYGDLP